MTYRDDHEAAVERVAALEVELADAKRVEAELRGAEPEAVSPPPPPPRQPATVHRPEPVTARRRGWAPLIVTAIIPCVVVLVLVVSRTRPEPESPRTRPEPEPSSGEAHSDETSRWIDQALYQLGSKLPGGYLLRITIDHLDADGVVRDGRVVVRFARKQAAPSLAYDCRVLIREAGALAELEGEQCQDLVDSLTEYPEAAPPRCTPSAIYQLALRDGAHVRSNATLVYDGRWRITIKEMKGTFSRTYDDTCTR